jgi:hypothetical protein
MKTILQIAAALSVAMFAGSAPAQSLLGLDLGNLITSGSSGSGIVSADTSGGNTSIGLLGSDGLSANLPTSGTGGGSSVGLAGVLEVSGSPTSGGGSSLGISVLGGTSQSNSLNPLGLLGSGGGIGLGLPNLGGLTGGGGNGGDGGNTGNTTVNLYANLGGGGNGGSGGAGANGGNAGINITGVSSRMQALLRILAARNYLRLANGRAVCLTSFNIAEVGSWIPQKDWAAMQNALGAYSQDIYTLRQLLANCRNKNQRQALNLTDLNRVIAIDIKDGQPILYML